jgi:short-subunit dehydrogenase
MVSAVFRDKVAIVTGGASGIGAALCDALAEGGAVAVVADRDEARAETVAAELRARGLRARGATLDVRDAGAFATLAADVRRDFGSLDLLINNAGILGVGEIRDLTPERWRGIVETNLFGTINGVHAAYPIMLDQRAGHIVNIASFAGLVSSPLYAPYAASKAAVVSMSAALRREAVALGVKVSVVCPGTVHTPIFDRSDIANVARSAVFKDSPLGRVTPQAAAHAILAGVVRNREFIVFPGSARLMWLAFRAFPRALDPLHGQVLARFRKARLA